MELAVRALPDPDEVKRRAELSESPSIGPSSGASAAEILPGGGSTPIMHPEG